MRPPVCRLQHFVGGADKTISIVDPLTGKIRDTLPKQSGTLRRIVASTDGEQIAAMYNLPDRFEEPSISVALLWDIVVRFSTQDTAVAIFTHDVENFVLPDGTRNPGGNHRLSFFLVKHEGRWLITSGQNTEIKPGALDPSKQ